MKSARYFLFTALLLLANPVIAQNAASSEPGQVDAQAAKILERITKEAQADSVDYDKLEAANKDLRAYLQKALTNLKVMSDPMKKAKDAGLQVFTSADRKVRLCSWDTLTGGTMHMFNSLVVYDAGNNQIKCEIINPGPKAESEDGGDPGSMFEELDTIKTKDGKTVYLIQDLTIASGMIHGRSIQAYTIANGKLTKFPMFQTPKKALDNISYAFGEYTDAAQIDLSADKQTLKIPIVVEDKSGFSGGKVTGKYLTYRFDGNRFVFQKGN